MLSVIPNRRAIEIPMHSTAASRDQPKKRLASIPNDGSTTPWFINTTFSISLSPRSLETTGIFLSTLLKRSHESWLQLLSFL